MIATSLSQPDQDETLRVRFINPSDQPIQLFAGLTIGQYTILEGMGVKDIDLPVVESLGTLSDTPSPPISMHLRELYQVVVDYQELPQVDAPQIPLQYVNT